MEHFIRTFGNIDFQDVTHRHGEQFRQACLDLGNAKNTVGKKIRQLPAGCMCLYTIESRQRSSEVKPMCCASY